MARQQTPYSFSIPRSAFRVRCSSFLIAFLLATSAWCQPSLTASSVNSGGDTISDGARYSLQTTLGQGGAIGLSAWLGPADYQIGWGFQGLPIPRGRPPRIQRAIFSDVNRSGGIEAGDQLVLTLDRSVIVTTSVVQPSHFFLPVQGDSLGGTGFVARSNPYNLRQIVLKLGAGARLKVPGAFLMQRRQSSSPSGMDFGAALPPGAITSLDGVPVEDGGLPGLDDSGVDIEYSFVALQQGIGPPGGTAATLPSPDAVYRDHRLEIAAATLATTTTFWLRPPLDNLGVINAFQLETSNPNVQFKIPATVRVEYREGDIDWERGQVESEMRVHQLVEKPRGVFQYVPVAGRVKSDNGPYPLLAGSMEKDAAASRSVSVEVGNLNPNRSLSPTIVFAGLPIETVDERTVNVKPGGSGLVKGDGVVVLAPGPLGAYTRHRIEFPNYMEAPTTDPARLIVKIQTAMLGERVSLTGGQSFPTQSGAIFLVTTTDAAGQPVAFTAPVHVTVQFKDRPDPSETDVVLFDGRLGAAGNMRVVHDVEDGAAVDFRFVDSPSQTVDTALGTVTVRDFVGLTGLDGRGVFGAVAVGDYTPAENWQLYR